MEGQQKGKTNRRQYLRIWALAAGEGTPTSSSLSKRPGRLRAESSASGLLVAAITTTPAPTVSHTLTFWLDSTSRMSFPPRRTRFNLAQLSWHKAAHVCLLCPGKNLVFANCVSKVCPCCARVGHALSPYAGAYMLHICPTADAQY